MDKKKTLRELLQKKQVFAPCIWDCFSARAVEMVGYEAMLLSGGALSMSMNGLPDLGITSRDEQVFATSRIANAFPNMPIIVDAEDGFGDGPLNVYHTCERLAQAGAMAITIEDTMGIRGWDRVIANDEMENVVPVETWLAKLRAAMDAIKGTDCMLIARTESMWTLGLDDAIERCLRAEDLGVDMTLILRLINMEQCEKVAKKVKGWKMYPDITTHNGIPDVSLDEIYELGFNLVTIHYLEKGAMWGMLEYGKKNFENKNAWYSDEHDMGGLTKEEQQETYAFNNKMWFERERKYWGK